MAKITGNSPNQNAGKVCTYDLKINGKRFGISDYTIRENLIFDIIIVGIYLTYQL